MVFDYPVKHDGVYYPAGENVPIKEPAKAPEARPVEQEDKPKAVKPKAKKEED